MTLPKLVYVVDDDEAVRDSMRVLLESCGMEVRDYASAPDFLAQHDGAANACLLLDIHMPGMSGLELLEVLREKNSQLPVIAITGRSDAALRDRARLSGAFAVLDKPVSEDVLLQSMKDALAA